MTDPAEGIELVPMSSRHLTSVMNIDRHGPHRAWSLGLWRSEIKAKTGRVYVVAKSGRKVVGFAGLLAVLDEGHITNIGTHPDYRDQKIASRMLLFLAQQAIAVGLQALTLEVASRNTPARALYSRFGLAPAGVRPNYYSDVHDDALVLWAYDIDHPDYIERLQRIEQSFGEVSLMSGWVDSPDGLVR